MAEQMVTDDQRRYARERSHHDARFAAGERKAGRNYVVIRACLEHYGAAIERAGSGRVLEYGCGTGTSAFELADGGAQVVGIDISGVAVRQAQATAASAPEGASFPQFSQMNAERLAITTSSIDLVCGTAILHHLDLDRATAEVARVLRPGGRAIFLEPLGHNPLVNLYRKLTPGIRTPDEHPLVASDFELLERRFGVVRSTSYALLALLAIPLRSWARLDAVLDRLEAADRWVFAKAPWLRRFAWTVVIELGAPREKHPDG